MLEDRDYMREPEFRPGWRGPFRPRWSWTVVLLAAYAASFLLEQLVQHFFPASPFFHSREILTPQGVAVLPAYLPLSLPGIERGYVWQLFTYQFMHAGVMHLLMNSWVIYFFGKELEVLLGAKKYLTLFFSSGVLGGVVQMLTALVWPQYFGPHIDAAGQLVVGAVVGASACGFGLVAAYALLFPERRLTLLLFFVIPLTLTARTLLVGSAVLAVAGFAFHDVIMPGVANAAHLGGMAMGWIFVRKILPANWARLGGALRPAEMPLDRPAGQKNLAANAAGYVESEVDPILDKISAQGIQSLTARERQILESARKRINR